MSRPAQIRIVAFALTVLTSYLAHAGHPQPRVIVGSPGNSRPFVVPQQPRWLFGFSVVLDFQGARQGLRIVRVQPGSPAHRAGLEVGDFITSSNGRSFHSAQNNQHAVALLQQSVSFGNPGNGNGGPVATFFSPGFVPTNAVAHLHVQDVRTGQLVHLDVLPTFTGAHGPIPTHRH